MKLSSRFMIALVSFVLVLEATFVAASGRTSLSINQLALKKDLFINFLKNASESSQGSLESSQNSISKEVDASPILSKSASSKSTEDLYSLRIDRVNEMERILLSSLELFDHMVSVTDLSKNGDLKDLDAVLMRQSDLIIEEFQKIVIQVKNEKMLYEERIASTKKEKDASVAIKQSAAKTNITDTLNPSANTKDTNIKPETSKAEAKAENTSSTGNVSPASKEQQPEPVIPIPPVLQENTVENVLKDVAEKADSLESGLKQDKFQEGQQEHGSTIETVVKVGGDKGNEEKATSDSSSPSFSGTSDSSSKKPVVLIDSKNNQYVLSKPGDATAHVEDTVLLQDLLILLLACCVGGIIMYLIGLPVFFGYILAGTILSKNRLIENAVQVETISRGLGVILIMFYLGLEFNLKKLARVWSTSLFGSAILLAAALLFTCTAFPRFIHASMAESFVIGSSVFLSSTAVVIHFLQPGESETTYGRSIMGILVAQDILLGFLLAIMPGLEQRGGLSEVAYTAVRLIFLSFLFTIASYVLRIPMLQCLAWLYKKSKISPYSTPLHSSSSRNHGGSEGPSEVFLLTSICILLLYLGLGQLFEQSVELSCFVAGVMIANQKAMADQVLHKLEPFKQIFSALFFASIGLHIYPSFLYNEGGLLISLTLIVMLSKAIVTFVTMNTIFRIPAKTAALIGVGLGQVSEFTFVLASKAKARGILSREFFFLLIGVTSMSMFLSPLFWFLSTLSLGMRKTSTTSLPTYRALDEDVSDAEGVEGREEDLGARLFERRLSVLSDAGLGVKSNDSLPSFKAD